MSRPTSPAGERPLSRPAKAGLIVTASATILLCYLFSGVSIILLLALLGVELILLVAGARFGLASFMADVMKRHVPLLGLFCRSFWLGSGTDYRILLQRPDAPRLFGILDQLATRLGIAVPHEVAIEMSAGGWVRLEGYRRGAGRTTLGLGYDLLAGLSQAEVEAVIAHEMAHAKLVHRGLKSWLNKGVGRSAVLTGQLAERHEAFRQAKRSSTLTTAFLRVSERLTAMAARLVAAYSRQDEFEADRGAAELCGAGPLRTALQRLEAMQEKLGRMPWRERVAQLELEGSFSAWLVEELKLPPREEAPADAGQAADPYSTHPSLADRIAALPPDDGRPREDAPGIGLLADPDRAARELMREIQRVIAAQEQKDTKSLGRWARKTQRTSHIRWQQVPGIVLVIGGVFVSIIGLAGDLHWAHAIAAAVIGGGVWAWRLGRYRDRRRLPVPRFGQIKRAWEAERPADLSEREQAIEAELGTLVGGEKKRRRKLAVLLDVADAAIAQCDYLRAHVAARLALDVERKSVEAALILAVANGALGNGDAFGDLIRFVMQQTALGTQATRWGAAWGLLLLGDWNAAEALLWQVQEQEPEEPTFLTLLAFAQAERGKLHSAEMNARRALALAPGEPEQVKLLARVLLDAGRLREAGGQLGTMASIAATDPEIAMMNVRWHLLRREHEEALQWSETLRRADPAPVRQLRVAEAFESARRDDTAARLFEQALTAGFYPEAHLGLARLATARHDAAEARRHLCAALNFEKPVGPRGCGPGPLFHEIVSRLTMLEDVHERCQAWIVTPPADFAVKPAAGRSFLIFGSDQRAAEAHFALLLGAMQPEGPPPLLSGLAWQIAPKERQPERPVRPGVQCAL